MRALASTPGALRLLTLSIVARVPLVMLGIGLLVHTVDLTGSYADAGLVTGAHAVALGVGGPLLGQLVDRRGQTSVLLGGACTSAALLCVVALLPAGAPLPVLVALAAGIGLAVPPLGACTRSLLPSLLPDPEAVRAVFAAEASAVECTWIAGPPVVLGLGALTSTGAALAFAGFVLLAGTAAFAAQAPSRTWRPARAEDRPRGGALRAPAMQTLVIVFVAVGVLFGVAEVAITAAASALGSSTLAAPLMGVWGLGSLAGGVLATRLGGGARGPAGLALVLAALAGGHLALVAAAGDLLALGGLLFIAGAAIAPAFASVYAMVDRVAPAGVVTEAFAWLNTAVAIGGAGGAAAGGAVADSAGPGAAFALAGGAGAVAVLVTILRSSSLAEREAPVPSLTASRRDTRAMGAAAA